MKDYPFSGDIYLLEKMFSLIKEYDIKTVIETGTWLGRTTQLLSVMVDKVYTIEINEDFYNQASYLSEYPNIERKLGSSPNILKEILNTGVNSPILFYLDAHWWGEPCPLLQELDSIIEAKVRNPIIVIHDCFNPNHPEFGYDVYDGQRLDYEFVKDELDKIYNGDYVTFYNENTTGEKRGVLFTYRKEI